MFSSTVVKRCTILSGCNLLISSERNGPNPSEASYVSSHPLTKKINNIALAAGAQTMGAFLCIPQKPPV